MWCKKHKGGWKLAFPDACGHGYAGVHTLQRNELKKYKKVQTPTGLPQVGDKVQ